MKQDRVVHIQDKQTGEWNKGKMRDLCDGDKFKLFESDGTPVTGTIQGEKSDIFTAASDSFMNKDDIWTVKVSI